MPAGTGCPQSLRYQDEANSFTLQLAAPETMAALPAATWEPAPDADDRVERVALSHLSRFFKTTLASLRDRIPTLPKATGQRWLLGTAGTGRLEDHDGTRVLFLSGTPVEMGRQQGTLLKKEIRRVVDRILYGIGNGAFFSRMKNPFGDGFPGTGIPTRSL